MEKAAVDGERKAVEADLGPVRYLATLLGSTDEATMRYFILIVALLLDPAAVLLLLAATHRDIWLRMAEQYDRLADKLDRLDAKPTKK